MGNIDPKTARQVWQRVAAPPAVAPDPGDLHGLVMTAADTAALYRALTAVLKGKGKEDARQLWEQQQETVASLRGIQLLSFGRGESPKPKEPSGQNPRRLLEQSYHRARIALTEYTARTIHPEFGPVFRQLAQRQEIHCAAIARILGQL